MAAAALFIAGCSSTTVVARDDRASATTPSEATAVPGDNESPDADASDPDVAAPEDGATDEDADEENTSDEGDDRGSRDDDADTANGFGLGGAEQLGALLTDCEAGSDLACDILFQLSDFDSVEETAALTCGGRSEIERLFCTEGIDAAANELSFDVTSDGLERVVGQCEDDGDMTACDFLYYRSPVDSDLEEIGATCGGRVTVAVPDCRTLLADPTDG